MINLSKIININIFILFTIYIFIRPVVKYFEYAYSGIRINITALATLFLMIVLSLLLLKMLKKFKIALSFKNLFPFFLIILVISIQIVNIPFLIKEIDFILMLKYLSMTFIGYISFYLIGTRLDYILSKRKLLFLMWIIMTGVFFEGFLKSETFFIYLNGAMIYLMLADSYAILSIILLVLIKNKFLKYISFFITSFILFTLVSRTSFFLFIFVSLVYFFILNWKTGILIVTILIGSIIYNWNTIVNDLGAKNRMIRIITTGEDSSYHHRKQILEDNRKNLTIERIILGQYMSDVVDFGHSGHYVHSYESFLYSFGILPYITLYAILLFIFNKIFFNLKIVLSNELLSVIFLLGLFLTIEITFSRAYVSPYIWMIVGALPLFIKEFKLVKRNRYVSKCIDASI